MRQNQSRAVGIRRWFLAFAGAVCAHHTHLALATPGNARNAPSAPPAEVERTVMFDLQPSERCNFGDLDVILNDIRSGDDDLRLQLSIETIGAEKPRTAFGIPREKKLPGKNLGTYQVRLPFAAEPTMYGVFLCTVRADQLNKAPCSSQRLLSFDQMIEPYRVGKGQVYAHPTEVEPKVYFAQFMTGGPASLTPLRTEGSALGKSDLERLGMSQVASESALPIVQKFLATLGSLPLGLGEERMHIVLPFFSDKKCNLGPAR